MYCHPNKILTKKNFIQDKDTKKEKKTFHYKKRLEVKQNVKSKKKK